MPLVAADDPSGLLYRVGRAPDPLAWTEWDYVGEGRFDGPERPRTFRVLYVAEQRLAAFVETLQKWRRSIDALAALADTLPGPGEADAPEDDAGAIPVGWHLKRMVGTLRVLPDQRWLDLRQVETRETLRRQLAPRLETLGYRDFDLGDSLSRDRRLTKTIARFAHENGFQGIAYTSRFGSEFDCWAIFEGAHFEAIGRRPIARDDPDLLHVAGLFDLNVP